MRGNLTDLKTNDEIEEIYLEKLMFVKRFFDYKKKNPLKKLSQKENEEIIEILEQLPSTLNEYIQIMKSKLN